MRNIEKEFNQVVDRDEQKKTQTIILPSRSPMIPSPKSGLGQESKFPVPIPLHKSNKRMGVSLAIRGRVETAPVSDNYSEDMADQNDEIIMLKSPDEPK